jgi:hypothetical protein
MVFSSAGVLADWFSIRSSLALLIFTILALLTAALAILRFFTVKNAVDLTLVLAIIFSCWSISNFIAFNVSSKFMEIGYLMGTNQARKDQEEDFLCIRNELYY